MANSITNMEDKSTENPRGWNLQEFNIPETITTVSGLRDWFNDNTNVKVDLYPNFGTIFNAGTANNATNLNNIQKNGLFQTLGSRSDAGTFENYSLDISNLDVFWANVSGQPFDIQLLFVPNEENTKVNPNIIIGGIEYRIKDIKGNNLIANKLSPDVIYFIKVNISQQTANIIFELPNAPESSITKNKDLYSEGFILNGFNGEINGTTPNQFDISSGEALIKQNNGNIEKIETLASSFQTSGSGSTWYLDLNEDGTYHWGTSHSTDINYLSLWELNTDGSGNIIALIDDNDKRNFSTTSRSFNSKSFDVVKNRHLGDGSVQEAMEVLSSAGDHSAYGNTITPHLGNSLRKLGKVITTDAGKSFMNIAVESPVVWFDDVDGYFHMVFTGYGNGTGQVQASPCHAKSKGLIDNWVVDNQPLLTGTGNVGDPDEYGGTGPYMIKHDGLYYLFYIGLTEAGYESGTKTICLATSPSLENPIWSRYGTVIGLGQGGTDSDWRDVAIWHPSIVKRNNVWYMFFNASGTLPSGNKERIGYATSADLINWTVDDANSPLITDVPGSWHDGISGDPSVYKQGKFWIMQFFGLGTDESASDGIAYTTDEEFPLNWNITGYSPTLTGTDTGNVDDQYAHKPFIYLNSGRKYHYYTSVSSKKGTRDISVAIDDLEITNKHYAADTIIKEITVPGQGFGIYRFKSDDINSATYDVVFDANQGQFKIERTADNGRTATRFLEISDSQLILEHIQADATLGGENAFLKANNVFNGIDDLFTTAEKAFQLILIQGSTGGLLLRESINTPTPDGVISWSDKWIYKADGIKDYDYDSGWFPINAATQYTLVHNLGVTPSDVKIQFSYDLGVTIQYEGWGFVNLVWQYVTSDSPYSYFDSTVISVVTGQELNGGPGGKLPATHMRFLANK